jgi:hypothetical protein
VVDKAAAAAVEVVVEEVRALDREAGRAMEVEVEAEVVVARAGVEVAEEEEVVVAVVEEEDLALARVTVAGRVMALDLEEGKAKAPHEHGGYRFFYITPFTIICVMK